MNTDFGHSDASRAVNPVTPVFMGSGFAALLRPGMTGWLEGIYRLNP
jgi:hypothetical protein